MSQKVILALLESLGGRATTREIVALARSTYPDSYVATVVSNRLWKLKKWHVVDRTRIPSKKRHGTMMQWFIVKNEDQDAGML